MTPVTSTIIRVAGIDDLTGILDIINYEIINGTAIYDHVPHPQAWIREWYKEKSKAGMPVIVAEQNGQVCGYGSYGRFRPKEGYKFSLEHSVYVAKEFQGKGIGSSLLTELIKQATSSGYHTMIAGIDGSNQGSIDFHAKFGFKEVARFREVGYKFDRRLDLVFMQLMLSEQVSH